MECQQPMTGDRVVIYHTDHIPLRLCEVRVKGYQYVQCAGYDGNFYYGPACGLPCNCATQCNYTTGTSYMDIVQSSILSNPNLKSINKLYNSRIAFE